MKIRIEPHVVVVTPSIGKETLPDAVSSIWNQDYANITHLVVADGGEYLGSVANRVNTTDSIDRKGQKTIVTPVPFNTGSNGYYGHRIYAAFSHLIDADYILFLDEDNWYKHNHVSSMVEMMEKNPSNGFGYSFRSIYSKEGDYLLDDNCESLGKWPIYWSLTNQDGQYLIDTSCYIFRNDFLKETGHLWHSGWGGDRNYYRQVSGYFHTSTFQHTVCYRLDGNPKSVNEEFFKKGNEVYLNHFKGNLPWNSTRT